MKNGVFWVVTPCGSCKNLQEPHRVTTQKTPFFIVMSLFMVPSRIMPGGTEKNHIIPPFD
jgi:hypothetical protein